MRGRFVVVVVALVTALATPLARAATSDDAIDSIHTESNVPVTMSDGTVLRANVYRPAVNGVAVEDRAFPVLLTQTPYGKGTPNEYLITHGYIEVEVDIRGRGSSQGIFEAFGPREIEDGVELVHWASALHGSTGAVGLIGCSYLGINQLLTAEAIGPNSPLKAIFPQDAANSSYRDLSNPGGMPSAFTALLGGIQLPAYGAAQPITDYTGDPGETVQVEVQHASYPATFVGNQAAIQTDSPSAPSFYNQFWDLRDPANRLDRIVANDIPTFLTGGIYDLFQRGETMNYAGLQNAFARRPIFGPMAPKQKTSGKYQLLAGPWYHCAGGSGGPEGSDVDLDALQLRWFDRWLKGDRNGIETTASPLHLWEETAGRWIDTDIWPLTGATTYYLVAGPSGSDAPSANDGALSSSPPGDGDAADTLVWDGASVPCATAVPALAAPVRCADDDRPAQTGPNVLTYTMDAGGLTLAGPGAASVYLTSTSPDAEITATISDIADDGTSIPVTGGIILASFRALDPDRTWIDRDGLMVNPYHRFTAESRAPLPAEGDWVNIELRGVTWRFAPGHKLRLTLRSSAAPWAVPTAAQARNLVGGVYGIQRNGTNASFVNLPLFDASALPPGCSVCGT